MKTKLNSYLLGIALAVLNMPLAEAAILYNNASTPLGQTYAPGVEFGDQVILDTGALPAARIDSLTFEYFLSGTVPGNLGNEQAQIRMYQNDGLDGKPGAMVFESPAFSIVPTPGSAVLIQNLDVLVNQTFTWTISFSGIEPTDSAGMPLYSPPTTGNNYLDYWEKTGVNDWTLKTIPGTDDASFAAIITGTAVPEVSVFWQSLVFAGVSGVFLQRRWASRRKGVAGSF